MEERTKNRPTFERSFGGLTMLENDTREISLKLDDCARQLSRARSDMLPYAHPVSEYGDNAYMNGFEEALRIAEKIVSGKLTRTFVYLPSGRSVILIKPKDREGMGLGTGGDAC